MGSKGIISQGLRASLAAIFAIAALTGTASAQSPAETQYGQPVVGQQVVPSTPDAGDTAGDVATGVEDADGAEGAAGGDDGSASSGDGAGAAGGTAGGDDGDDAADAPDATALQFGPASEELEADIAAALDIAGLDGRIEPATSPDALSDFLESDLADQLGDDPKAVGQALGAQLVSGTPLAEQAYNAIFGTDPPFAPVQRAILTKDASFDDDESAFLEGLATGLRSTDIPLAFVERTDSEPSNAKFFSELDVLTVGNLDTDEGKLDLAAILLGEATTQDEVEIDRASAVVTEDSGSAGAVPWIVLALLAGGGLVVLRGGVRAPARR